MTGDPVPLMNKDQEIASLRRQIDHLRHGGGGGTSDGMDSRVTRLETHFGYIRKDLDEIKEALKLLPTLATKRDLTGNTIAFVTIGLAVVAIVIGGIIGGLAILR